MDSYIKWNATNTFSLTVGKQKPQIGYYDWLPTSNAQPTFERSQIFNQLNVDRLTGIVAEGEVDRFTWQSGLYSNEALLRNYLSDALLKNLGTFIAFRHTKGGHFVEHTGSKHSLLFLTRLLSGMQLVAENSFVALNA